MALTTVAAIKAIYDPALASSQDAALTAAISYGDAWIKRVTGRPIESAEYTEYFDGRGQYTLVLKPGRQPVIHSGGTVVVVTESGSARTVALGYDESADVILEHANEDRACRLEALHRLEHPA